MATDRNMGQNISVKILGREFPFEVGSARDEELIRAAAEKLTNDVELLQYNYQGHDIKDAMSIVMLSREVELMELREQEKTDKSDTARRLEELDASLEEYLLSR